MKSAWVYILECSDGTYYTGCTTNFEVRIAQHEQGYFDGYTASRRPVKLEWAQEFSDINEAITAERHIKGWGHKKKEALMRGDFNLLHELADCKNETNFRNKKRKLMSR